MVLSTLEAKQQERSLVRGRKAVLNKMVKEGHTKKTALEEKPEGTQVTSLMDNLKDVYRPKEQVYRL